MVISLHNFLCSDRNPAKLQPDSFVGENCVRICADKICDSKALRTHGHMWQTNRWLCNAPLWNFEYCLRVVFILSDLYSMVQFWTQKRKTGIFLLILMSRVCIGCAGSFYLRYFQSYFKSRNGDRRVKNNHTPCTDGGQIYASLNNPDSATRDYKHKKLYLV